MRPGVSSNMLKREASFVKRLSFHNSNASRFTNNAGSFSSPPLRSLDFLPVTELPIKHLRLRKLLWPRGRECSISHPKNLLGQ